MSRLCVALIAFVVVGSVPSAPAFTEEAKDAQAVTAKPDNATIAPRAKRVAVSRRAGPVDGEGRPLSTKSASARIALCKADCSPAKFDQKTGIGVHGIYRSYQQFDPQLVSIEGKREYAECVQKCAAPLPTVYVQRPLFAMGMNWFGKSKQSCLDCHEKGH